MKDRKKLQSMIGEIRFMLMRIGAYVEVEIPEEELCSLEGSLEKAYEDLQVTEKGINTRLMQRLSASKEVSNGRLISH